MLLLCSCLILCDLMDYLAYEAPLSMGCFQAREPISKLVVISSSSGLQPRVEELMSPCLHPLHCRQFLLLSHHTTPHSPKDFCSLEHIHPCCFLVCHTYGQISIWRLDLRNTHSTEDWSQRMGPRIKCGPAESCPEDDNTGHTLKRIINSTCAPEV